VILERERERERVLEEGGGELESIFSHPRSLCCAITHITRKDSRERERESFKNNKKLNL
jgi:hypothetical protein